MRNSKYVDRWEISEHPHGVYSVIFSLTERWLNYYAINETTYVFGESENDTQEEWESKIQEIPEFLNFGDYLETSMVNKDEVIYFFIPYNIVNDDKKIINSLDVEK